MLFHYLVKYCQPPQTQWEKAQFLWKYPRSIYHGKKLIRMEGVTKEVIESIALQTKGFSGREITKMVIAWHDAAFTLPDAVLTPDLMEKVLGKFHLQHKLKETWTSDEAKLLEKLIFTEEDEMTGTKDAGADIKDAEMVRQQEALMDQINKERLEVKDFREHSSDHSHDDLKDKQESIKDNSKSI